MCICHIVSEYKNNLFLSQIKVLFENSVHLSHSFRIESGSRLITASRRHNHTHRRGATALCRNPVRGAQRSVPGLDTPLLTACRRYATTPEPESDRASGPHLRHSPPPRSRSSASPPTSAHIVAERRHSAITRYAERSAACRDLTRPCCRRAGGTPLLQSRSPTARAVSPSVNPRRCRGAHAPTHMRRGAPPMTRQGQPSVPPKILQPRLKDLKV